MTRHSLLLYGFCQLESARGLAGPGVLVVCRPGDLARLESSLPAWAARDSAMLWVKVARKLYAAALVAPYEIFAAAGFGFGELACGPAVPGAPLVCRPGEAEWGERTPAGWRERTLALLRVSTPRPMYAATLVAPLPVFTAAGFAHGERTCGIAAPGVLLVCRWDQVECWERTLAEFHERVPAGRATPALAPSTSPPASGQERSE